MGWILRLLLNRTRGKCCGHSTRVRGEVSAFKASTTTRMPLNNDGTTDYCLDCIGKMAVRCGWCGEPIFIGDPVTLYSPRSIERFNEKWEEDLPFALVDDEATGLKLPETAVVYQPTEGRTRPTIVGCGRRSCAESGADYAGVWLPGKFGKGYAQRIKTPYEVLLGDPSVTAVVSNHSDLSKAEPQSGPGITIIR